MINKIFQVPVLFCLILFSTNNLFAQTDTLVEYLDGDKKICAPEKMTYYSIQFKENTHYKRIIYYKFDDHVVEISYSLDSLHTNLDGLYREFNKDKSIIKKGTYIQNKKVGIWRDWHGNGNLSDSTFYENGIPIGISLSWYDDGNLKDSTNFDNNGNGKNFGFWYNRDKEHLGEFIAGKKSGLWTYYYKSGIKCQEIFYKEDSAINLTCFDEKGNQESKKCVELKEADFKGGQTEWVAYLKKKLSNVNFPSDYYKGKLYGTCLILFVVDKEGNLTDFKVEKSVSEELDKIAIKILKNSPKWIPAMQNNRIVRAYRLQPITFAKVLAE